MSSFEAEVAEAVARLVLQLSDLARATAHAMALRAIARVEALDDNAKLHERDQLRGSATTEDDVYRLGLSLAVDAFQREWIMRALAEHGGNVSKAAKALQTNRAGLQRKISVLGYARRARPRRHGAAPEVVGAVVNPRAETAATG